VPRHCLPAASEVQAVPCPQPKVQAVPCPQHLRCKQCPARSQRCKQCPAGSWPHKRGVLRQQLCSSSQQPRACSPDEAMRCRWPNTSSQKCKGCLLRQQPKLQGVPFAPAAACQQHREGGALKLLNDSLEQPVTPGRNWLQLPTWRAAGLVRCAHCTSALVGCALAFCVCAGLAAMHTGHRDPVSFCAPQAYYP